MVAREELRTRVELERLALALAAHKAERGAWPKELKDLCPEYVREVPRDRFTSQPIIYKRRDAGYLLYSVGPNMTDDGGREEGEGADDLVVRVPPPEAAPAEE